MNNPEILRTYVNALYEPNPAVLWPCVAPQSIVSLVVFHLFHVICCLVIEIIFELSGVLGASVFAMDS